MSIMILFLIYTKQMSFFARVYIQHLLSNQKTRFQICRTSNVVIDNDLNTLVVLNQLKSVYYQFVGLSRRIGRNCVFNPEYWQMLILCNWNLSLTVSWYVGMAAGSEQRVPTYCSTEVPIVHCCKQHQKSGQTAFPPSDMV